MLIREGQARSLAHDRRLAVTFALVAGGLNSAGFSAIGVFSANMSGNVSTLADRVAIGDVLTGAFYLGVVATFVSGASSATVLVATGKRQGLRRIYAIAILAEAGLLLLLGLANLLLPSPQRGLVLVLGLSAIMGAQNAIVTLISNARVRSTHVSGMATDVGIDVGRFVKATLWRRSPLMMTPARDGLRLHGVAIAAFCAGGVLGVTVHRVAEPWFLFGCSLVLAAVSLLSLRSRYDSDSCSRSDERGR